MYGNILGLGCGSLCWGDATQPATGIGHSVSKQRLGQGEEGIATPALGWGIVGGPPTRGLVTPRDCGLSTI